MRKTELKPGDIVEILNPAEIMNTLDADGTLGGLPFMPEMIRFCGKKFTIKSLIDKTCAEHSYGSDMREFQTNDVFSLDDLRCDGSAHGACQAGCTLFWKADWLKKSEGVEKENIKYDNDLEQLKKILKTKLSTNKYLCQSTNLLLATTEITKSKKLLKIIKRTLSGNMNPYEALGTLVVIVLKKLNIINSSEEGIKGSLKKTPSETLNLQPGEIVEVKSFDEILKTLDENGKNKGLGFNTWMKEHCGKRMRVRNRAELMIDEVTGEMKKIKNTVILENSVCQGCSRASFNYWREIWLKRL